MEERKTRRRLRRVRYEANVYIRGARQEGAVVARAHNLSAEGIAVSALDLPAEGEEVECRLMLGGRRTRLRGRVAWVHRAPPAQRTLPAGGGIQFISLDRQERELLARLVDSADDGPQLVDVWVPGLEHPLPMRALIGTDEVKLGMALPQLVVGMPLRISFVHRGVAESRNGSIQAVRFLSGDKGAMSRVALQVSTPRLRDSAGLISTESFVPRATPPEGVPTESMMFDLAAMAVPGAMQAEPGQAVPGLAQPPPEQQAEMEAAARSTLLGLAPTSSAEERTPVIPYEVYEQQNQMPGPVPAGLRTAPLMVPFPNAPASSARRRWWIPGALAAGVVVALLAVIGSFTAPPPPPAAEVPVAPPRPATPAPAPPLPVLAPAGIQPLPPKASRAPGRAAAHKRFKARAARRRAAAAASMGGTAGRAGRR